MKVAWESSTAMGNPAKSRWSSTFGCVSGTAEWGKSRVEPDWRDDWRLWIFAGLRILLLLLLFVFRFRIGFFFQWRTPSCKGHWEARPSTEFDRDVNLDVKGRVVKVLGTIF